MFEPTPTLPNVDFRQLFMWIEQSHIWPFRLNITFGWLQKLNPGYKICIISYQVNLSSEVSAMFNSLMPSLNIRSLPFVVFLGGFPSRCQNLSSGAIRPGGLLSSQRDVLTGTRYVAWPLMFDKLNNNEFHVWIFTIKFMRNCYFKLCLHSTVTYVHVSWFKRDAFIVLITMFRWWIKVLAFVPIVMIIARVK